MNRLMWCGVWLLVIVVGASVNRLLPVGWYYTAGFVVGAVAQMTARRIIDAPRTPRPTYREPQIPPPPMEE